MYKIPALHPEEILIYLRKSRADDPLFTVEEVLAKHESILKEWVEHNLDGPVPEKNIYREVVSGETIDDRPEMLRVLHAVESPAVKAILVVEVQRLSRGDLEDAGRLIKLLRYTHTVIITPQKTYDLEDDYDRDFFERELKRGNEYLEYSKKIMNRGRLLSVSQGNYIGSIAPYGYDKTWIMEGKKKCPTLSVNEKEADVVRMIFDMYVNQDMGRTNIANRLDELGIKPRNGAHFTAAVVKDILSNIHYIGKVRWNRRKTVNIVEGGIIRESRPKNKPAEQLVYDGKHPAIISEALFLAAQAKTGRNTRVKASTQIRNPLAGLVYCQCGHAMSLRTYNKQGIARSAPRMICDDQAYCKTSSCLYSELLDLVKQILSSGVRDFEIQLKQEDNQAITYQQKLISNLTLKLEELKKKEISQWEKYSEEAMPKEVFDILNSKVLFEKKETERALKNAVESIPVPEIYEERIQRFSDALDALNDFTVPASVKNRLLKSCIEKITYSRKAIDRKCSAKSEISLDVSLRL